METKKPNLSPGARLANGAAILSAAQGAGTELIKARLDRFAAMQRGYAMEQRKVEALETHRRDILARNANAQDDAVEAVARTLVADGHPRTDTFFAYSTQTPTSIKKLTAPEKPRAILELVEALRRAKGIGQATLEAAQVAEAAARAAETALVNAAELEGQLHNLRHKRDAIGVQWDGALARLRRATRAASDDAPDLYASIFGRPARSNHRPVSPAVTPVAPAAAPAPAPVAVPAMTTATSTTTETPPTATPATAA